MARGKRDSFRRPKAYWHPRMALRRLLNSWPFMIWIAAAVLAFFLIQVTSSNTSFNGVVETVEEPIAPLDTARIRSIEVRLGHVVKAGDIIVQMETAPLDARIAIEQARIAEAEGTLLDYEQSLLKFVRDFELAVQESSFEHQVQQWDQRRDTAQLTALHEILADFKALRAENLIDEREIAAIRPEIAALEQTVDAFPVIVALHSNRFANAVNDRDEMYRMLLETPQLTSGADTHKEILAAIKKRSDSTRQTFTTIQERRALQRTTYTLRATRDGVVSSLYHQPGDVVQAGQPIVRIVGEAPTRIIGFLPEVFLGQIDVGDHLLIWELSRGANNHTAVVQSISPDVRALPGRLSPVPGRSLRGRNVILLIEEEHSLVPGQSVTVTGESKSFLDWAGAIIR